MTNPKIDQDDQDAKTLKRLERMIQSMADKIENCNKKIDELKPKKPVAKAKASDCGTTFTQNPDGSWSSSWAQDDKGV